MWKLKRKKYITEEEFLNTLKNNFCSISRDIGNTEKDIVELKEKSNEHRELTCAIITLFKDKILTKAQLKKKVKVEGKDYTVKSLLDNGISILK